MRSSRLLLSALLVTGCASTSVPATYEVAGLAPRPELRLEADSAPSSDGPAAPLPSLSLAALRDQDPETAQMPANRHSYGVGAGVRFRDGDSALSINGSYRYWVNEPIEVGAIADLALSPIDTFLIAAALWWHPNDRLTLLAAPGFEFESGDGSSSALRLGASYRLMLEQAAIRPFFFYDFVDERDNSLALGISIGI